MHFWNERILFFLSQKLFIEREIKLFNNFLVLRVMTTAKRSNEWSFLHIVLDGAFVGIILQNWAKTKPFFRNSHPLTVAQISFSQCCVLALSQLWHIHYLKTLSAHPTCDHVQLSFWQKASLGGSLLLTLWNKISVWTAFGPLRSSSMKDLHCDLQVWWLLVRQAGTWDPLLQTGLTPGQKSPQATKYKKNYKGLKITVCMHS